MKRDIVSGPKYIYENAIFFYILGIDMTVVTTFEKNYILREYTNCLSCFIYRNRSTMIQTGPENVVCFFPHLESGQKGKTYPLYLGLYFWLMVFGLL